MAFHAANLGKHAASLDGLRDMSSASPRRARPFDHPVMKLQRQIGNRAVDRLVQAKLIVSPPGDAYELEADRLADGAVRCFGSPGLHESVQRQALADDAARPSMVKPMRQPEVGRHGLAVAPELEARIDRARGAGHALPAQVRRPMERALSADFSDVRIHADSTADELNQAMQAWAFTTGHDIFFRAGGFDPASRSGQHLLAHELAHVVQQTGPGGWVQRYPRYLTAPIWGASTPYAGATWMKVVLGPDACESTNFGTVADSKKPKAMKTLRKNYKEYNWKSGHLLNNNMGGTGDEAYNLTPLTGKANAKHTGFEGRVKNAIAFAHGRAYGHSSDSHWYGVEYEVSVGGNKWSTSPTDPRRAVDEQIIVHAKSVVRPKAGGGSVPPDLTREVLVASTFDESVDNSPAPYA